MTMDAWEDPFDDPVENSADREYWADFVDIAGFLDMMGEVHERLRARRESVLAKGGGVEVVEEVQRVLRVIEHVALTGTVAQVKKAFEAFEAFAEVLRERKPEPESQASKEVVVDNRFGVDGDEANHRVRGTASPQNAAAAYKDDDPAGSAASTPRFALWRASRRRATCTS